MMRLDIISRQRLVGLLALAAYLQIGPSSFVAAQETEKPAASSKPRNEFLDNESSTTATDPVKLIKRTLESMRSAENSIRTRDAGKQTQQLQQSVLEDLDRLIKLAENQQSLQKPSAEPNGPPQEPPPEQPDPQTTEQPNPKESPRRKDSDPSQESTQNTDPGKKTEVSVSTRERLVVQQVWGNLPPKVQTELKSMPSEKYLKQYEQLIKRFYEALAERH